MLKFELIGCAPGLAFGLLLRASGRRALGRILANPLLDLLRVLFRLRDHFIYDSFGGGVYTYAHDMRMYANTICNNNP